MKKRGFVLLAVVLFAIHADAQSIEAALKENKVPALGVGIIRDGRLREVKVFGELAAGVPAPYDAIFNVASLTKPVVTMLTLRLVSMGKWDLDEPLANYWTDPDVAADPRAKQLTTRHVLTHRTGFKNWRWLEESKKLTFNADPGTQHGYSGEGFEYLRNALERKFHKPLAELSASLIFGPLGMHDTRHAWDEDVDETRFARWHDQEGKNAYRHQGTDTNAADDLLTTVEDYRRFGAWVLNGAGLPQALFDGMVKRQVTTKPNQGMGLGWEVLDGFPNGEYAILHSGSDRGVHALIVLFPKSRQGLVLMTNGDNGYRLYERLLTENLDLGKELMARAK
ncbi:MAG TPA: serine hydrolase domain-containing protein [Thermoanaerobaculia bacterium]|nr:serine hydrolase domain-containing protein [Thermoanaerobaculia bacterium]